MTSKKKIIVTTLSISLAVVIAAVFTALALTVWKPRVKKTTQQWLDDFKNSLAINKDGSEQKTEKSIVITENGAEVARYYQLIEIKNQDGKHVSHFSAKEEYPSLETREFDVYDEYYFIDGTMYMQRTAMEETNGTSFISSLEVFWEVVSENLGSVTYDFSESNFENLNLTHEDGEHAFTAAVSEKFFVGAEDLSDMSDITVSMAIDDDLNLIECKITYRYKGTQNVEIKTCKSVPSEIEIKDFVKVN
ncbi:MAG: hypothetical protein K2I30_02760 [Clostridia bacterium]|nr:hypothetical protein [Clostridia bacterium]